MLPFSCTIYYTKVVKKANLAYYYCMALRFYNTLSKTKEDFTTIEEGILPEEW
jgi:hypothetical protein